MTLFRRLAFVVFAAVTPGLAFGQTAARLMPLPPGWRVATEFMAGFPAQGLELYVLESAAPASPRKIFCLAWDPTAPTVAFKPVLAPALRTPSQLAAQEPGVVFAAINGGYFGGNQSFSHVQVGGVVLSPNIKSLTRTFQGAATAYFPTRAAFGITAGGRLATDWIYSVGSGNANVYAYPAPSPNRLNAAPQPVPTAAFPAGGAPWVMQHAIGGSPMLLKDGAVAISDAEELIDINNTTSRPRSALGHTASGLVLAVAVEGDNASGPAGLNLADLAAVLRSLGCVGAINLDGGGSTSLVVGGRLTVRPGDAGNERAVISALLFTDPAGAAPVTAAPAVAYPPWNVTAAAATFVTLQSGFTGGGLGYRWTRNGVPIPGATQPGLTLPAVTAAQAGAYAVTATNALGSVTSRAAALAVVPGEAGELVNVAVRADSGPGADVLIVGFSVRTGPARILARATGPGLAQFNVTGFLNDPVLELRTSDNLPVAANDDWNAALLAPLANALGAFAVPADSRDAALVHVVAPGGYGALAAAADRVARGNVLAEIYDAGGGPGAGRLANLSARARVPAGDGALIAGFVVRGSAAITVLIRGIGPALREFDLPDALPAVRLALVRPGDGATLLVNAGWAGAANALEIRDASRRSGAFALAPGAADAAMLVTLDPGAYTAVATSPAGAGGVALVEVYEVR